MGGGDQGREKGERRALAVWPQQRQDVVSAVGYRPHPGHRLLLVKVWPVRTLKEGWSQEPAAVKFGKDMFWYVMIRLLYCNYY